MAKIGIVLTVGIDGIWVMLTIYDQIFGQINTKLILRRAYSYKYWMVGISMMIGVVSAIPSVWAAFKFN